MGPGWEPPCPPPCHWLVPRGRGCVVVRMAGRRLRAQRSPGGGGGGSVCAAGTQPCRPLPTPAGGTCVFSLPGEVRRQQPDGRVLSTAHCAAPAPSAGSHSWDAVGREGPPVHDVFHFMNSWRVEGPWVSWYSLTFKDGNRPRRHGVARVHGCLTLWGRRSGPTAELGAAQPDHNSSRCGPCSMERA